MYLTRFVLKSGDAKKGMEVPKLRIKYSEEPKSGQGGTLLVSIFCK